MIDGDSDSMSLDEAVTYVAATLHCYRDKARELVRKAINNLKVKSITVHSSPKWLVSVIAGQEVFYSDHGESIEVCRKDVVELCLELRQAARRSSRPKKRSAVWNGVSSAIADLWPNKEITVRGKDRNDRIHEWLISRRIIGKAEDVTRTIQRVLKEQRNGHR
jgi:hypothetical protein